MRDKNNEPQGPNLMVSRHGASANLLLKCAECQHLSREEDLPWVCEQFTTPGGYKMPWNEKNAACGKFQERENEVALEH